MVEEKKIPGLKFQKKIQSNTGTVNVGNFDFGI